jgi:hypothetical protein
LFFATAQVSKQTGGSVLLFLNGDANQKNERLPFWVIIDVHPELSLACALQENTDERNNVGQRKCLRSLSAEQKKQSSRF